MSVRRKNLNLLLLTVSLLMGGWAACLYNRRPPVLQAPVEENSVRRDTVFISSPQPEVPDKVPEPAAPVSPAETPVRMVRSTSFGDADPGNMTGGHPFSREAAKLLSGRLEETDSINRHRILSYCEHLRTSYTTRDIDFIRQVFSDNALIIVGHVVKTGKSADSSIAGNSKVSYSVRTKGEYLERLSRIFESGKDIDLRFSGFRIMRHPTMEGIYGVTLRQGYSCGAYSDDGYLFLLWDFRNASMPLIHVRTWQPAASAGPDGEDIIGMGDFNLE